MTKTTFRSLCLTLTLLLTCGLAAASERKDVCKSVPEWSRLALEINWTEITKTAWYQELRTGMQKGAWDAASFEEQTGLKLDGLFTRAVIFYDLNDRGGALVAGASSQEDLFQTLKDSKDVKCQKITVAETPALVVSWQELPQYRGKSSVANDPEEERQLVLAFPANGLLLVTDMDNVEACLKGNGMDPELLKLLDCAPNKALINWAILPEREVESTEQERKAASENAELEDFLPLNCCGNVCFTGKQGENLRISMDWTCISSTLFELTKRKYQEIYGLILLMASGIPEVGPDLPEIINVKSKDPTLYLTVDLQEKHLKALRSYLEAHTGGTSSPGTPDALPEE